MLSLYPLVGENLGQDLGSFEMTGVGGPVLLF